MSMKYQQPNAVQLVRARDELTRDYPAPADMDRRLNALGPPASAERESVLSDFIKQMGKARAREPRKEEIPKPTEQPTGRPPSEQFKPECSIEQLLYEADGCSTADYVLLREIIERLRAELVTVRGTPRPLDEFDPL